jgi:hypothetical protein
MRAVAAVLAGALLLAIFSFPRAAVGQRSGAPAPMPEPDAGEEVRPPAAAAIDVTAATTRTIVELQPFRQASTAGIEDAHGRRGTATLINLNPHVNSWFLLRLRWNNPERSEDYHLENIHRDTQSVSLGHASGTLEIGTAQGRFDCELWSEPEPNTLQRARDSELPYAPLCDDRLYLRNPAAGKFTLIERVTDLLRDHVRGGDRIVSFVREHAYRDAFAERGTAAAAAPEPVVSAQTPRAAQLRAAERAMTIDPPDLGLDVDSLSDNLLLGRWYPVSDAAGIYFSLMRPSAVADAIVDSDRDAVNPPDNIEAHSLDYLVAMDLTQFKLHYELGTDHPRLGWSERVLPSARDPAMPGPDGIASPAPLVVDGMVSPALVDRTAAAFAAGFKREHGAFRYGALALVNHGSHYGFMEHGVLFSTLQPGLATLYTRTDGFVDMKTWTAADSAALDRITDARQNGVPLIDFDPGTGRSSPGSLVSQWGAGNWSGSEAQQLRTVRAGVCLQETATRRFLLFGYFSTATPSAMTRVFQAYGCRYAMPLDMNALEHTYFALYTHAGGRFVVQHLIQGMAAVDRKGGRQLAPRFLGFPDDRDFFYITRESSP